MTVDQLVEFLRTMPSSAEVQLAFDGAARLDVDTGWLARGGYVVLASSDESIYYTDDRPESAPTEEQDPYWKPKSLHTQEPSK